nr:hypothetical protein [Gloeobacter kilaueensis]
MLPLDAMLEVKVSLSRRRCAALALVAGAFGLAGPVAADDLSNLSRGQPFFSFHSGFWLNLHHFLYQHGEYRKFLSNSALPVTRAAAYRKALAEYGPSQKTAGISRIRRRPRDGASSRTDPRQPLSYSDGPVSAKVGVLSQRAEPVAGTLRKMG